MKDKQKVFSFAGHILLPDNFNGNLDEAMDYYVNYKKNNIQHGENFEFDMSNQSLLWDYFVDLTNTTDKQYASATIITEYNSETNLMDTIL